MAGVAALATPVAAAAAAHASMIALMMDGKCSDEPKQLPVALHPIKALGWDTIDGSEDVSAIIGNMTICAGVAVCCFFLLVLLKSLSPVLPPALRVRDMLDAQGLLRFPSTSLFVLLFLYQGSIFSSMRLIGYANKGFHRAIGLVATGILLLIPHLVAYTIKTSVPTTAYYKTVSTHPKGWKCISDKFVRAIVGSGEWVSVRKTNRFVQRYQTMLRSFKQDCAWFIYFDFMSMVLLAGATIPRTPTWNDCGHVKLFSCVINILMLASKIVYKPYARYRDTVLDIPRFAIQATALFFMALAFYSGNIHHWGFAMSGPLIIAAIALLLLKVLLDIVTELYIFCTDRREKLQEEVFKLYEQQEEDFDKDIQCLRRPESWNEMIPIVTTGGDGKRRSRGSSVALSNTSQRVLTDYLLQDQSSSEGEVEEEEERHQHEISLDAELCNDDQPEQHPFVSAWKQDQDAISSQTLPRRRNRLSTLARSEGASSNESFGKLALPKSYRNSTPLNNDLTLGDTPGNQHLSRQFNSSNKLRSSSTAFTDSTESIASVDRLFSKGTNRSSRSTASSRRSRRQTTICKSPQLSAIPTPPSPPSRRPPMLPKGRGDFADHLDIRSRRSAKTLLPSRGLVGIVEESI